MKKFEEYEEEIYKCSRCGLCQSVCPVFKASLNECAVSRGKFNMLNGVLKGDLKLNQKIKSYLDMCTGCNACKDFCPSKIDARKIFVAAKEEYYKTNSCLIKEQFLNSYFGFKCALNFAKISFNLYRFLKLEKLFNLCLPIIKRTGYLGRRLTLINALIKQDYKNSFQNETKQKAKTAVYFEGCFNKYLNPQTEDAVKKILEKSDINLIKKDFECCGVSYLNDGDTENFLKLVKTNVQKAGTNYDYILTDCASCFDALKSYENYFESAESKEFANKVTDVAELITKQEFTSEKKFKIAVHKPCHDSSNFIDTVKNIKNTDFIEVEDYDKCCGFSGKFALKYEEISQEISRQKAQKYIDSDVDIILTTCPACILGLEQGLAMINSAKKPKVMNLFVFIAKYCL